MPAEAPTLWSTVREALKGSQQDLTAIPVSRAVVLLAVPTILEMSMESVLTIVDIFFVSRLGSAAIATVGLTESMLSPTYALAMGLSAAATAVIARRAGQKDWDGAGVAAVQVILLALLFSGAFGVAGALFAGPLLRAMGAGPDVLRGAAYTAIMLGGSVTIFLLFVVNAIFRSVGDAATAMRALWIANLTNMLLAPCLIFGLGPVPALGVAGAAVATTVGRGVGVLYQAAALLGRSGHLRIARRHLALRLALVKDLLRLATPATGQVLIETLSWLGLVRILSSYDSAALAGYTIAMRVVIFSLLPAWGLAQAASALVGQNLGAGEAERARQSVLTIARYNMALLAPFCLLCVLAPGLLVALFTKEPAVVAYANDCLRIVALGLVVFAFGMVTIQAFNGAGDTTTPMLVNLGSFWGFKLPCALALAWGLGLGPRGVFIAITAAYTAQSALAGLLFRRRWPALSASAAPTAGE